MSGHMLPQVTESMLQAIAFYFLDVSQARDGFRFIAKNTSVISAFGTWAVLFGVKAWGHQGLTSMSARDDYAHVFAPRIFELLRSGVVQLHVGPFVGTTARMHLHVLHVDQVAGSRGSRPTCAPHGIR